MTIKSKNVYQAMLIFALLLLIYKHFRDQRELKEKYITTHGCLVSYNIDYRSYTARFKYVFEIEDDTFIGWFSSRKITVYLADSFNKKTFPVVYEKNNIKNNRMLILPQQFEEMSIPFPDSLYWVKKYLR